MSARLSAVLALLFSIPIIAADPPTVAVSSGPIRGSLLDKSGATFKGIPYAQPPVGELRWRETRVAKSWAGVRDATAFGASCAQNAAGRMDENSSEDCLFLNVWTPDWPPTSRQPVMVWMHGGGNYGGTASSKGFDGESLARHGVVVVTINYRLTIFGFFAHPELTGESSHHSSGNYGLLDQIEALNWVRDNISKFGGDPGNVTIFGQSAGAVDVNVLMTSPLAKGLFHRVIAESGTVTRNPDPLTIAMSPLGAVMGIRSVPLSYSEAATLQEAEKDGEKLAAMVNAPAAAALKYLRGLPAADLLKAASAPKMSVGPGNGVVADGWVFPKSPAEVFVKGEQQRVPLLIGNNSRERTPGATPDELAKSMEAMYGSLAARAGALYRNDAADPLYGVAGAQWVVDTLYRCPVVAQVTWHASAGNAAYEYQFDRAAPGREALGATHGVEVPYVFGTLDPARYTQPDQDLSSAIQAYWTNFAKTGDPNGGNLPRWPKFDTKSQGFMEFTSDGHPKPGEGLRRPFCDLYQENVKRLMGR